MGCGSSAQAPNSTPTPTPKHKTFTGDSANFESERGLRDFKAHYGTPTASATTVSSTQSGRPPPVQEAAAQPTDESSAEDADLLLDNKTYEKIDLLSDGTSSTVILASVRGTKDMVAIKFLKRASQAVQTSDREVLNMQMCSMHPNIIRFREVFLTPQHLAIVCEYAEMGDLADYIAARAAKGRSSRALPEAHSRALFQQIMLAVDFCHARGISNRDLKAENVLLTRISETNIAGNRTSRIVAKLCDFGFSKDELLDSVCKTACGTPEYIAPEVLMHGIYDGKQSDIWSAGVMLYVMLTGQYPFRLRSDERLNPVIAMQQMFPRIMAADFRIPDWVSAECADILTQMICPDPQGRISIEGVMHHPWFCKGMPAGMLEMNKTLLEMPDNLHIGFMSQSHDEIMTVLKGAMRR